MTRLVLSLLGSTLLVFAFVSGAPVGAEDFYSPGGWSTLHRGPANRKFLSQAPLPSDYRTWTALEGAAVLTAPTMSPDGRTLFVTTGRGAGHSNLHAFDLDGELRWKSAPWQDADHGIDPCAILSSAIVDRDGDLYLGDCNQLFAYRSDGRLKWVVPLPSSQEGDWRPSEVLPVNALTTAILTREGFILGVTNFGDVIVVDRETGRSVAAAFRLPGHLPNASTLVPRPDSAFSDGLVDPEIREWAWQLLFGGSMRSSNTPAVDLESGRVFVAATSTSRGQGALYGLDLTVLPGTLADSEPDADPDGPPVDGLERVGRVEISIAFATEIGPGSGSSPSLALESDVVYVSDEAGLFYAIDADTGAIRWQLQTKSTAAAAAVGGNGDIYSLQADGPALIAITREGQVRWQSDLQALAEAALPASWLLGEVVAIGNGNPTVVGDVVLVPIAYGYETHLGRRIPWLVSSSLVAIDVETGIGLRNVVTLADDSTGISAVLPDGTILNSLGTAITSGIAPLAGIADWLLPEGLQLLTPVGGIQVSRPLPERPQ
jgi:outer membrane protein assembly factor BamB